MPKKTKTTAAAAAAATPTLHLKANVHNIPNHELVGTTFCDTSMDWQREREKSSRKLCVENRLLAGLTGVVER